MEAISWLPAGEAAESCGQRRKKYKKPLQSTFICAIISLTCKRRRGLRAPKHSVEIAPSPGPKGRCSVIPKLILSIIDVAACLFLIAVVLLQSGKSAGLSGAIAGVADTFLAKNKAKSWDAKLAKMTKWVAIGFMILTFVICLI